MHGLSTYYNGARQYYAALPIWDRVDPLCEKDYGTSPYLYCLNDPIKHIDPDGKAPGDAFKTLDEAALNFCLIYNFWSIMPMAGNPNGSEYTCTFYSYKDEDGNTMYSYYASGPQGGRSANHGEDDLTQVPKERLKDMKIVGIGHTHGGYDPKYNGNDFSKEDIDGDKQAHDKIKSITAGYLATTNGQFKKHWFDSKTNKWYIITYKGNKFALPSDANDATHGKYTYQSIVKKYNSLPLYKRIIIPINKYLEQHGYK